MSKAKDLAYFNIPVLSGTTFNLSNNTLVTTLAQLNAALSDADLLSTDTAVSLTGNQTIAGIKTFSSTITGSVSGNAGTVTNGVYTTGNQTIGGDKTFTGTQVWGGTSVHSFTNISGSYTGYMQIGGRGFRKATTGNALEFINNANTAVTHTFADNGNFVAAGAVTGTNLVYTSGDQTVAGVKTFSSGPVLNNSVNLGVKDSGGTTRPLIGIGGDNLVNIWNSGNGVVRVLNQAGSAQLVQLSDAAGNFSANGSVTAAQFNGSGAGLTGTAASLTAGNITGVAAIANGGTSATTATAAYRNLTTNSWFREINNGGMSPGATYSVWTGGGAILMYLPSFANTIVGDKIYIENLHLFWQTNNFTIARADSQTRIMMLAENLVCNINVGSIVLTCAWKDASFADWNVSYGG